MDTSLARYIWTHTRLQQLYILIIVVVSMIPYFLSFDLPKQIVSGPIQGKGFDKPGATQTFMHLAYDLPLIGHVEFFHGIELDRFGLLVALSAVFLVLVVINGLFKFYINTYKGRLGERMLRRIRFELIDRMLRFPPHHFKRVKPSELATMVKDEVEPLGGFIGDAFVQPMFLTGQAATALIFIVVQDIWLGTLSAGIVGVQILIIPRMRRRLIRLGRERQLTARELSGRVGEVVEGIAAVHTHDTSNYERAEFAARLGRIFKIRYDLYQWKFMVKFINNFLTSFTPFLFYSVGGYLVLQGKLDVGQLVAVISAYKDLPGPLKDLIDWDQARQDVQVKYAQVVEQFDVEPMLDPDLQKPVVEAGELPMPLAAVNLTLTDDGGAKLLEHASVEIHPGQAVAIVGTPGGGGEALADAFARLILPDSGRVTAGGHDLLQLPESVTGRRITYAGSEAFLFQGTLRDNLLYGLKHAPLDEPTYDGQAARHRQWELEEARKAGNPLFDIRSNWIDYSRAGATGPDDVFEVILPVLDAVMISSDLFDLGLRASVDPDTHPEIAGRIVDLRVALRERIDQKGMSGLVVPFEDGAYNREATVAENLLFGIATGPELADEALAANPYVQSVLAADGLDERLYAMGFGIAENLVELFRDLPPDHPFLQQLTIAGADELPAFQALVQRREGRDFKAAEKGDRIRLTNLAFAYVEPRYRFGLLDDALMADVIHARRRFYRGLPKDLEGAIERYDWQRYNRAASLMDNLLFGRAGHQAADAGERLRALARDTFKDLGLYVRVIEIGLEFNAGVGGKRLTAAQRQLIVLARALLKRTNVIILNRPISAVDTRLQERIVRNVLEYKSSIEPRATVVWVLAAPELAHLFDHVIVFDRGAPVEQGRFDELTVRDGVLKKLLAK